VESNGRHLPKFQRQDRFRYGIFPVHQSSFATRERSLCIGERPLPLVDVEQAYLRASGGGSFCEWKGPAHYWDLVDGTRCLERVAWSYPQPLAGAEALGQCIAFYAHELQCSVGGARVLAQPGGFYGGWITPDLAGPFKGDPGSGSW
jgi:Domain of unknown function (DUF427)